MKKDVYQKIIELKNQGYTYKAIANELHVSKTKISKALHGTTKKGTKVPSREVPGKTVPSTTVSEDMVPSTVDKSTKSTVDKSVVSSTIADSTVDKNTVAEIYSLAFQSCLELLQMRFGNQFNINAQETQPEEKSDTVGWDKWEPSKIIHTENGTEIIMNGKRYTKAEYLSRYTDEEIELYKNLFVNDDNDDVAQEPLTQEPVVEEKPETPTNEPPNSEPPKDETAEKQHEELIEHQKDANPEWADLITDIEKSKFDVDEDGFCALKTKKW